MIVRGLNMNQVMIDRSGAVIGLDWCRKAPGLTGALGWEIVSDVLVELSSASAEADYATDS